MLISFRSRVSVWFHWHDRLNGFPFLAVSVLQIFGKATPNAAPVRQEIPYKDFPMHAISLFACWDGEHWVIMLPSEYWACPAIALILKINYSVVMSNIKFEWDARKASANEKKHGISFDEARTVFFDENAKLIDDPDHSGDEERFVLLGLSSSLKVVLVCHCYREEGNVIRIISARKASTHESKQYR